METDRYFVTTNIFILNLNCAGKEAWDGGDNSMVSNGSIRDERLRPWQVLRLKE